MASQFAPMLLGTGVNLDGVWHTAIIVHGVEWFYGGGGIEHVSPPGTTMMGSPLKTQRLGDTHLDSRSFRDYLEGIGKTQFEGSKYDLFQHNCNNFSNEVAKFLCPNSSGIPKYILELPERILQTPFGAMLKPIIEQMTPHGENLAPQISSNAEASSDSAGKKETFTQGKHIPVRDIVGFRSNVDAEKLIKKLSEFNNANGKDSETSVHYISTKDMETLSEVLRYPEKADKNHKVFDEVWEQCIKPVLLTWPTDTLFPILDLLRWQLGRKGSIGVSEYVSKEILDVMLTSSNCLLCVKTAETASRLILRVLPNLFLHPALHKILSEGRERIVSSLNNFVENYESFGTGPDQASSNLEVGISTIALNFSIIVANLDAEEQEEAAFQLISALGTIYVDRFNTVEALYRAVIAIGNFLWLDGRKSGSVKDLAQALDIKSALTKCRSNKSGFEKIKEATIECDKLLC